MKVKSFIYCLIGAFLCSGCSQLGLVAQIEFPEGAKQPQVGHSSGLQDSLKTKNHNVQNGSAQTHVDSSRVAAVAKKREAESYSPMGARKKLVPFRERTQTFWTCVGACTLGGFVIGTVLGMAQEPKYHGEDSGWPTITGMMYGTAIGCGVGVVVGTIVAAKDDILMLGDESGEIRWEK